MRWQGASEHQSNNIWHIITGESCWYRKAINTGSAISVTEEQVGKVVIVVVVVGEDEGVVEKGGEDVVVEKEVVEEVIAE